MTNDRSTRTFIAAILLLAAVLVAMNRAVTSARLADWWLPALLAIAGIVVAVYRTPSARAAPSKAEPMKPAAREYLPPSSTGTASLSATSAAVSAPAKPETAPTSKPPQAAKTEIPEQSPAAPPAKKDKEAAAKKEPEAEVVAATTANPPQAHETENTGEAAPKTVSKVSAKPTKKGSQKAAKPQTSATVTSSKPDDLVKIDGIGPKVAAALLAAGIDSFQKLADTSEAQTLEILSAAKVRVVGNYGSWAQQASFAARGDWDGLDKFNRERKAESGS